MQIQNYGTRGTLFTFSGDDSPMAYPTSVYLINATNYLYLCDTHLGPASMSPVMAYIRDRFPDKPIIVFNSHRDYDHIWGNCVFGNGTIIAHELCRKHIEEKGALMLQQALGRLQNGAVTLKSPNLTFDSRIVFEEDGVEFFHTPGHTDDSASCLDTKDGILFVGDLVERPIPYLGYHRLDVFIDTLTFLENASKSYQVITGHSGLADTQLIRDNLAYVESVHQGRQPALASEEYMGLHEQNLKSILVHKYEDLARKELGELFSFESFLNETSKFKMESLEKLEELLENYISSRKNKA